MCAQTTCCSQSWRHLRALDTLSNASRERPSQLSVLWRRRAGDVAPAPSVEPGLHTLLFSFTCAKCPLSFSAAKKEGGKLERCERGGPLFPVKGIQTEAAGAQQYCAELRVMNQLKKEPRQGIWTMSIERKAISCHGWIWECWQCCSFLNRLELMVPRKTWDWMNLFPRMDNHNHFKIGYWSSNGNHEVLLWSCVKRKLGVCVNCRRTALTWRRRCQ